MMTDPVLLIDSYAQIYRAFHAVRNLTSADGTPVNAVFAIARLLLKLEKDYPSKLGSFVFDKGKPPRRMALLPEYKANRPPMPQELRVQIPIIRDLISAFGWTLTESEGYEADDLLASIADAMTAHPVVIFSADKDIAQIIDDRVTMQVPEPAGGCRTRDKAEVLAKFGVRPDQIIDYLALLGDSADNIPGVEGVGPKTAAQLLQEFGSGKVLFESLEKIPRETLRNRLSASKEIFFKNVELVRLDHTPPAGVVWTEQQFLRRTPDWEKAGAICKRLGLRSILKDFPSGTAEEEDSLFSVSTKKPEPPEKAESGFEQMSLF